MKDKALELVDWLLRENTQLTVDSAYMIRNLIARVDLLESDKNRTINVLRAKVEKYEAQTKPLSDKEIEEIANQCSNMDYGSMHIDGINFARAIEERHGIK